MFVIQKEQHGNKCLSVRDQIKSQTSHRRRKRQPTPVFLPGKFHGQRSLADYSPWGRKKSDMTEHTYHTTQYHHLLKAIGKSVCTHYKRCPYYTAECKKVVSGQNIFF